MVHSPDLPPEQYLALEGADDLEAASDNEMSRRTLLRGLVGLGLGASVAFGALRLDTEFGDQLYGGGEPEVGIVEDTGAERNFPRHFNIVGGGFGVYDIEGLAAHVHDGLGHFGQTAYIKNSNSGLNPELQKRKILDFLEERGGEVVNLYGHSMHGMLSTEIGHYLLENGVEVQSVLLDCSPESIYDVRPRGRVGAEILAAFARYGELLETYGGPVSRFTMESATRIFDGRTDFKQIAKEALRKLTPKTASNRLLEDEALYIEVFDSEQWGPNYPQNVIVAKMRPQDWSADPTINNRTALIGWRRRGYPQLTVHDVAIRGGGHANPGAEGAEYTKAIVRFGLEMNLYQSTRHYVPSGGHPIP